MKKMRRYLALLLAVAMMISMVQYGGSSADATETSIAETTVETVVDDAKEADEKKADETKAEEATTEAESEEEAAEAETEEVDAEKKAEEAGTEEEVAETKETVETETEETSEAAETSAAAEETTEAAAPTSLTYEDDEVKVTVKAVEDGSIPAGAALSVIPILKDDSKTSKQYAEVEKQLTAKAEEENREMLGFLAYDISLENADGEEIEPEGNVKVTMKYKKAVIADEAVEAVANSDELESTSDLDVTLIHLEENASGKVTKVVDMVADKNEKATVETNEDGKVEKAEFVTDSFSAWAFDYSTSLTADSTTNYTVEAGSSVTISSVSTNSSSWQAVNSSGTTESTITVTKSGGQGPNSSGTLTVTTTSSTPTGTYTIQYYSQGGWGQSGSWTDSSYTVTVTAAKTTYTVYVYVAAKDLDGNAMSDECLELLGIDNSTIDGNGYFPAGQIEISKSMIDSQSGSTTAGEPLINSQSDWETVLEALGELDTSTLIDEGGVSYTLNKGNKVGDYIEQAAADIGYTWGTQRTALFRWNGSEDYGFTNIDTYHLDLRFTTNKITFVFGNNGITSGDAQDGNTADTRVYITDSIIQSPKDFSDSIPEHYVWDGKYYTDADCTTEWNGIGTELSADQTVYIKLVPEGQLFLNYQVASSCTGYGTVDVAQETIYESAESATGSTATANENYEFVGWYFDDDCTVAVPDEWVTDGKIVPVKAGVADTTATEWVNGTTYYAKFKTKNTYEVVNFYLNLTSTIMDTTGSVTSNPADQFTKSVSGSKATYGIGLHTDYLVEIPAAASHTHSEIKKDTPLAVIASNSDTSASKADDLIRQLGNGQTGNMTSYGVDQSQYSYKIVDGNGNGSFPTDDEIFDYITTNWTDVSNGGTIKVDGDAVNQKYLNSTYFAIRWYVFKDEATDQWHVDGVLVPKSGKLTITKTFNKSDVASALSSFKIAVTGNFFVNGELTSTTKELSLSDATSTTSGDTITYTWPTMSVYGSSYTVTESEYGNGSGNLDVGDLSYTYKNTSTSQTDVVKSGTGSSATFTKSLSTGTSDSVDVETAMAETDVTVDNESKVEFTNNYELVKTDLDLKKVTSSDDSTEIDGAVFKLYKGSLSDEATEYTWTEASMDSNTVNKSNTTKEITGLESGIYKLEETTAPTGYTKLTSPIYFKVANGNVTLVSISGTTVTEWEKSDDAMWLLSDSVLTIKNTALYSLPSAGGSGIYATTLMGMLLMMCSAFMLIIYKKKARGEVLMK